MDEFVGEFCFYGRLPRARRKISLLKGLLLVGDKGFQTRGNLICICDENTEDAFFGKFARNQRFASIGFNG